MLRYLIPVVVFAVLVGFFWVGLGLNPGEIPSPLIGKPAPIFELPRLRDPEQSLNNADMQGQVSLLNVWATWCFACRQEHPILNEIAESGVVPIFGLNLRDQRPAALRWLEQLGDPYAATGFDGDGAAALDWGVYGAPETFLVDADGTILYKHIAPITHGVWRDELLPRIQAAQNRQ